MLNEYIDRHPMTLKWVQLEYDKIFAGEWACVRKKSNNITYRCKELKRCLKKKLIWIVYHCRMIRYIRGHSRTGNYLQQLNMCHILGYRVCNLKGSWFRSKTNISIANVCHHFDVWLINYISTLELTIFQRNIQFGF